MITISNNIYKIEKNDIKNIFKYRDKDSHKGTYGKVGLIGGSIPYSGSLKLANMSAASIRSGAGIVKVIAKKELSNSITPYLLEQTFYPLEDKDNSLENCISDLDAIGIGIGWGITEENKNILIKILKIYKLPIVIDADGLNILSTIDKNILKRNNNKIILTPHLKEFSRLTNLSIEDIKKNPLNISRSFAKKYKIILLLKGTTTIITDGDTIYLSDRGCAGMATGGSGDVLTGILVGLLGYNQDNLLTVASASYLAGLAGELAENKYTDISQKASDTIEFIPAAIKEIRN